MAKTGRVDDWTNVPFAEGAPDTGTIVVTIGKTVTTYDVTLETVKKVTNGWPKGATREKFTRKPKDGK